MGFKTDFAWGAATASYQIEGAAYADGKGLSVWDICSHKPGFVKDGHNGDIACDHYNKFKEDVKLMKEIGLKAYRFSISWPRVMPDGIGKINEVGLDFYDKLVDELLNNGIEPYVTLFHWDYPNELFKKGGFLNRESSDWFAEYTKVVIERLSDRVKNWMTFNEPQCFVNLGYGNGIHAPGLVMDQSYLFELVHNILLAHGKAVKVIRKYSKQPANIGMAPVFHYSMPVTNSEEDIKAFHKQLFSCSMEHGAWSSAWWLDPVFHGSYPEDGLRLFEQYLPNIQDDDMKIINQPIDFFGFNYYQSGIKIGVGSEGEILTSQEKEVGNPHNALHWKITPDGIYYVAKALYNEYKLPLLITENGITNLDWVSIDGKVHDPQRIDYMHRHLLSLGKAIDEGVDVLGYMYWSLMDNFEWAEGYNERFGLIHVDYQTQERTLKDSAYWYQKIISSNGTCL